METFTCNASRAARSCVSRPCVASTHYLLLAPRAQHKRTAWAGSCNRRRGASHESWLNRPERCIATRAKEESADRSEHGGLDQYLEVKVDSVRVTQGNCIVFLRILASENLILQVHIGEQESQALLKEIGKQRAMRPSTHDLTKNLLSAVGYRVTKIRITDMVSNTYYARIHVARVNALPNSTSSRGDTAASSADMLGTHLGHVLDGLLRALHLQGAVESEEVDVDARPSDAINLAVRFGAPMYVAKRIAEMATPMPTEPYTAPAGHFGSETNQEIVRSVREALASFEDPTVMFQLQKELAIKDQRYEDAHALQQYIYHEMTHNQLLRLVVAMEAALSDQRYDEAARLRDEYKRVLANQQVSSNADKR